MLDLPDTFGKAHHRVNIRRLKFFEERDEAFGDSNQPPQLMVGMDGIEKFEVCQISNASTYKGQSYFWVEWTGYDQSHNCWVLRDVLLADVPALLAAYEANSSSFNARASAPKRGSKGGLPAVAGPNVRVRQQGPMAPVIAPGAPGPPPAPPPPIFLRRAGLRQR